MVCKEFNLNAFSKVLDGNEEFIENFLEKFSYFYTDIQDIEEYVEEQYTPEPQENFEDLKNDSFLTSKVVLDELDEERNHNFLDILVKENKDVNIIH